MRQEAIERIIAPDYDNGQGEGPPAPNEDADKTDSTVMAALHDHLYGREEEIGEMPLAEVLAELAAEGIDPTPLINRVRACLSEDGTDAASSRGDRADAYPIRAPVWSRETGYQQVTWRPKIFIGSSRAGKRQAELLAELLSPVADCMPWVDLGDFKAAQLSLDALDKSFEMFTHAVFILSPNDHTAIPEWGRTTPSDNLNLLIGLFIGKRGRHSVFLLTPGCDEDWTNSKLPGQLLGVARYTYQIIGDAEDYDLQNAYSQILIALHASPRIEVARSQSAHAKFWNQLSNTIVIIFGGSRFDQSGGAGGTGKTKLTVSQHDLEAALRIYSYLSQHYPKKHVLCLPTTNDGWQHLMQPNTDLILIGGFVANPEFRKRHSYYERRYNLRMGRLCRPEGQRVFHVEFGETDGRPLPPRSNPEEIEEFPSKFICQDYGLVVSQMASVYGGRRRVITITGVKGNGTLGAALALTDSEGQGKNLDTMIASPPTDDDSIEIVVSVRVTDDQIDAADFVEVMLNDAIIYQKSDGQKSDGESASEWEPCELGRDCAGCTFGLSHLDAKRIGMIQTWSPAPRFKALVFDLDDTLVDTFNCLIAPLESAAAQNLVERKIIDADPVRLAAWLLELRREDPTSLEDMFRQRYPDQAERALAARGAVFDAANVSALTISAEVVHLLSDLRSRYELLLVTSGSPDFQNAKIDHLGIRRLFHNIKIFDCGSNNSAHGQKEEVIRKLIRHEPGEMVVIGNRLDQEIRAGKQLGMKTVWLRQGEGSEMIPNEEDLRPDHTIYSLTDLKEMLTKMEIASAPSVVSIAHLVGRNKLDKTLSMAKHSVNNR